MPIWRDIEKTKLPKVRQVYEWWLAKRGQRRLPDRADFDPAELKPLLPYILMADFTLDPFRVRYRLAGTTVVELSGCKFAGRYLDELLPPDSEEQWENHYRQVYESALPVFGETTVPLLSGDELFTYEFGIFPLSMGGEDVRQFLAIEDYGSTERRMDQVIRDITPWKDPFR
jgi:hypothetical protein